MALCLVTAWQINPGFVSLCQQQMRDRAKPAALRVAFSSRMFSGTNPSDARAAIKVWADSLAQTQGIGLKAETMVYESLVLIEQAMKNQEVDMVALRIDEFLTMASDLNPEKIFFGSRNDDVTEQYILLSQQSIETLSQLRNRRLVVLTGPRTGMSLLWLDTVLLERGLAPGNQFFSEIMEVARVSQAVLPIFFGQGDACLVTQSGYQAMVELNPQVGNTLKMVLASSKLVPSLVFFRPGYDSPIEKDITRAILELHENPYGKQVLMLFKLDRIIPYDGVHLQNAKALFEKHLKLKETIWQSDEQKSADIRSKK